jgi:nucleoside-diphosphate-sugar epimerase
MQILIVGYGYIGARLAKKHLDNGDEVHAISRNNDNELVPDKLKWRQGDLDQPQNLNLPLLRNYLVYYLAPPLNTGTTDPRMGGFLERLKHNPPKRIVYMSTTAVYGDVRGAWVDESAPTRPQSDRGKRRLDAERQLTSWCSKNNAEWVLLRVTGIYGPQRLPLDRLKAGTPIIRMEEAPPTNRIHADDLVNVCFAAAKRSHPSAIYNVSDGNPTTMSDYFLRIAKLAKLPEPPQISLQDAQKTFTNSMLEFINESKKISNRKMLQELGVTLKFPDLEKGLNSCFS